ncbi:MAG: EamA family transporter [Gammaproteobacteria bacterium]|nr:EamA family transporter [Gammaproteobacteria bacterium]
MSSSASWIPWAILSACFAALTAILAKLGVKDVDSDLAMAIRTVIVAVLIVPFVLLAGKWSNPANLPGRTLMFLTLSALATGASWLCYFKALQLGEVSKVALVDKLSIVLVIVLAVVFLGERPSGRDWTAIGLMVAGLALLAFKR